jgi:hypothetical protein
MVTHKTPNGFRINPSQGAESHEPLPPPAKERRLELGRAVADPCNSAGRRLRGFFFDAAGEVSYESQQYGDHDASKEKAMEALMRQGYGSTTPPPTPEKISATPEARTARGATIFAAIWLALAVGSPLIVRYAPSADDHALAAWVHRIEQPRGAKPTEFVYSGPGRTLVARDAGRAAEPDL